MNYDINLETKNIQKLWTQNELDKIRSILDKSCEQFILAKNIPLAQKLIKHLPEDSFFSLYKIILEIFLSLEKLDFNKTRLLLAEQRKQLLLERREIQITFITKTFDILKKYSNDHLIIEMFNFLYQVWRENITLTFKKKEKSDIRNGLIFYFNDSLALEIIAIHSFHTDRIDVAEMLYKYLKKKSKLILRHPFDIKVKKMKNEEKVISEIGDKTEFFSTNIGIQAPSLENPSIALDDSVSLVLPQENEIEKVLEAQEVLDLFEHNNLKIDENGFNFLLDLEMFELIIFLFFIEDVSFKKLVEPLRQKKWGSLLILIRDIKPSKKMILENNFIHAFEKYILRESTHEK